MENENGTPGERVGTGACADVFAWGEGRVVKLFRRPEDLGKARREYANSLAVWRAGLPTPRVYELVDAGGLPGIVFERVAGPALLERMAADPFAVMRTLADLARRVHALPPEALAGMDLRPAKESLRWKLSHQRYLTAGETAEALRRLDALPDGDTLCHGDLHPLNVLDSPAGPVLIDWMDASLGHPARDILWVSLIWRFAVLPGYIPADLAASFEGLRGRMDEVYLDECARLFSLSRAELEEWFVPLAASKLQTDAAEEEKQALVRAIRERL